MTPSARAGLAVTTATPEIGRRKGAWRSRRSQKEVDTTRRRRLGDLCVVHIRYKQSMRDVHIQRLATSDDGNLAGQQK